MKLTQAQQDALHEFQGMPDSYVCRWKPKTMAKLAFIGLTEPAQRASGGIAYRITDAGREMLATLSKGR